LQVGRRVGVAVGDGGGIVYLGIPVELVVAAAAVEDVAARVAFRLTWGRSSILFPA